MKRNLLRQIDNLLYQLTKVMGSKITIFRLVQDDYDLEEGNIVRRWDEHIIKRVLIMKARQVNDFVYDLSFIAANKNFTYGGYFGYNRRWIIIRKRDLPKSFIPNLTDHVEFEDQRWEVTEITTDIDSRGGYLLTATKIDGSEVAVT